MTFRRNFSDCAYNVFAGNRGQKAEPYHRRREQTACSKVRISRSNRFIKSLHLLVQLRAHSAYEQITKRRHFAQDDCRSALD